MDWPLVLAEDFPAAAKFCYQLDQTIDAKRKQMEDDTPVWKFNKAKSRNNQKKQTIKTKESIEKYVHILSLDCDFFLSYYISF